MLTLVQPVGAAKDGKYKAGNVDQFEAVLKLSVAAPFTKKLPVPAQYKVGVSTQEMLVAVVADPDSGDEV